MPAPVSRTRHFRGRCTCFLYDSRSRNFLAWKKLQPVVRLCQIFNSNLINNRKHLPFRFAAVRRPRNFAFHISAIIRNSIAGTTILDIFPYNRRSNSSHWSCIWFIIIFNDVDSSQLFRCYCTTTIRCNMTKPKTQHVFTCAVIDDGGVLAVRVSHEKRFQRRVRDFRRLWNSKSSLFWICRRGLVMDVVCRCQGSRNIPLSDGTNDRLGPTVFLVNARLFR